MMDRIGQIEPHKPPNRINFFPVRKLPDDVEPLEGFDQGHLGKIGAADPWLFASAAGGGQIFITGLKLIKQRLCGLKSSI